jgi:hypothetical protein
MGLIGRIFSRWARRTSFLARRLWLVATLEVVWMVRRHWRRLEPDERRSLLELAKKSRGRPSRLTARERQEASELLEKLDYAELGGDVTQTLLPFRPLSRLVQFVLGRPMRSRRRGARAAGT